MVMLGEKLDEWSALRGTVVLYQTRRAILSHDADTHAKSEVKNELVAHAYKRNKWKNNKKFPQKETKAMGSQPQKRDCGKCGRSGVHDAGYQCSAAKIKCNVCGVVGHYARMCRNGKNNKHRAAVATEELECLYTTQEFTNVDKEAIVDTGCTFNLFPHSFLSVARYSRSSPDRFRVGRQLDKDQAD
eukprot:GHVR01052337.1.p1 GENE.GHVR01052337.1~~GHVR01052337.1.p1  ORF type:complete len:187 (+),score=27.78 GHVR01052337.1:322-882(+)